MIPNGLLISLYRQDLFTLRGLALQSLDICREQIKVMWLALVSTLTNMFRTKMQFLLQPVRAKPRRLFSFIQGDYDFNFNFVQLDQSETHRGQCTS